MDGFFVIAIARTVHSLELVDAAGSRVLRDDLGFEEQVVFFLDAVHVEDLEWDEYEAHKEYQHIANEIQVVHSRQPVVVRDRVGPVEEAHVAVADRDEDVEGHQQNVIEHDAD